MPLTCFGDGLEQTNHVWTMGPLLTGQPTMTHIEDMTSLEESFISFHARTVCRQEDVSFSIKDALK